LCAAGRLRRSPGCATCGALQQTRIRAADDSEDSCQSCSAADAVGVCWGREEVPAKGDAISQPLKAKCQRVIDRNRQEQPAAAAAAATK
jgi:hypothetical protein